MNKLIIKSNIVSDDLASFKWNFDLNIENKKYNTVEEANDMPLAKEMFYLPFIKSVSISKNQMLLERFDIVSWEDVLNEVEKIIEKKLQSFFSNELQIDEKRQNIITLYAESTPNPNVMKFVCNKLLTKKIREVKRNNLSNESKFINSIFSFDFIEQVFLNNNYISVTLSENYNWDSHVNNFREFLKDKLEKEFDFSVVEKKEVDKSDSSQSFDKVSLQIIKIIDEYIKPSVAMDGGNILFKQYHPKEKLVEVVLQGACSGCPSSTITLKNGIENMLKEMVPGKVETVSAING
ncbi:NifU family protein [Bacteroidota bacterium]|nr:NifU family protein [Bacteroidota bacterium]